MNRILIATVLLLCHFMLSICEAQNPVNESARSHGMLNDVHKDYWPNGNLRLSYTLKNGNLEGEYLEYYKSGKQMGESYFEAGHFNGTNKSYNEDGQIIVEETFAHDTLLSYIQTTWYKSGKIKSRREMICDQDSLKLCPFLKPQTNRNYVIYDLELTAKSLKSHGKYVEYYESGMLMYEDTLVNNMIEGYSRGYYESGKMRWEGTYHHDKENGTFTYYSKTGEIEKKEEWVNGKQIKAK